MVLSLRFSVFAVSVAVCIVVIGIALLLILRRKWRPFPFEWFENPMACQSKQIAILMMNSPDIGTYAHYATIYNYLYSRKHGYAFLVETCPDVNDVQKDWMWNPMNQYVFVWSKPVMIRRHLLTHDYVMFIDSDAVFYDFEKTIESFIETHMQDPKVGIVIASDCRDKSHCYDSENVNTGSMLVKNTPATIAFLEYWIKAAENECKEFIHVHPREQACLNILHKLPEYKDLIRRIPYHHMNGRDGEWIRHFMEMKKEEREIILKNILAPHLRNLIQ